MLAAEQWQCGKENKVVNQSKQRQKKEDENMKEIYARIASSLWLVKEASPPALQNTLHDTH